MRAAGIEVVERVLADKAADQMAGYLTRSVKKRPEVSLKLALSADGKIGRQGAGQVAITGPVARAQAHLMRAESDAILIGVGTALADDPELTVRLPGLHARSPVRIVLDPRLRLPLTSKLVKGAGEAPLWLAAYPDAPADARTGLEKAGARILAAERYDGRLALPELLEDLAGQGVSSVLVEGGAETARAFLADDLVDRVALFEGQVVIGPEGIASPLEGHNVPSGFRLIRQDKFGDDAYFEWARQN